MPTLVKCPTCGKQSKVADELLGKKARCPQCNTRFALAPTMDTIAPGARDTTGVTTPLPSAAPLPASIGRDKVLCRLGGGAFGDVYKGHDPDLDRPVALKVPRAGTMDDPNKVERFLREARSAAKLSHPNIVAVYDAGR